MSDNTHPGGAHSAAPTSSGSRIKSLETAFTIIDALKRRDGARITDIVDDTGLSKSTVHKHLATLREHGYVVKNSGSYELGFRFLDIGGYVRAQFHNATFIKGKLQDLAAETGEISQCMTEQQGQAIVLYRETGVNGLPTRTRPGKRMYLHQTASGKAILSQLPEERVDEIVDQHGLPAATDATITERDELRTELEEIRERGVAYNYGESTRGLCAVAAPVTTPDGRVHCTCTISGPRHRMEAEKMTDDYVDLLLSVTNEIELEIAHG
ncbi:helix-turn-helix domain-containing protein [Natronomonas sp. CBA1123]|uniref:IclR family transcriptional regulator n=1 Tax=Natronomonas sp. CBA1123 TaxID=2668070 RepID=UPI0012EAACA8|nr:IclR family transcriptional regulator [Natronomonas sp. CBA1123]MUV85567.1 helix-turn-helix domain-containing protein [Natronomonas sp. CBA1123]